MRVLVCGSRTYHDQPAVWSVLDRIHGAEGGPITSVIQGGATGADRLADYWAGATGVACETFPADWATHGKAAGPIRNQRMIDVGKPDLVIAFPGGRGTADMVRRARAAGIRVIDAAPIP